MASVRCPHCQLPLTDDEARADVCSACGGRLRAETVPVAPRKRRRAGGLLLLLLVVPLLGVGAWAVWRGNDAPDAVPHDQQPDPLQVAEAKKEPVAEEKKPAAPPEKPIVVDPPAIAPAPVEDAKGLAKMRGLGFPRARAKDLPTDEVIALAKPKAERRPPIVVKRDPSVPRPPILQDGVMDLNQPNGEFRLPSLNNGRALKLVGQVKTLRLSSLNGGASLDATELRVETILIDGGINGRSTLKLTAPKGRVHFRGSINGESTVIIDAPDGVVILAGVAGSTKDVDIVNGQSQLKITTRELELQGVVNGTRTLLDVTFTKQGRLTYHLVQGQSRVDYRRADPGDPQPIIAGGKVRGEGKVRAVD